MKTIFLLCLLLISSLSLAKESPVYQNPAFYLKSLPTDEIMGSEKAHITIIEYSNYSCPHCSYFHKHVFPEIEKKYILTGKIKWITRLFVSDGPSFKGALLTECFASSGKYYLLLKILFERQDNWAFGFKSDEFLKNIAKLSGMNDEQFNACMSNKTLEDKLLNQRIIAQKVLNITGTPTFFINGKESKIHNLQSFEDALKPYIALSSQ